MDIDELHKMEVRQWTVKTAFERFHGYNIVDILAKAKILEDYLYSKEIVVKEDENEKS